MCQGLLAPKLSTDRADVSLGYSPKPEPIRPWTVVEKIAAIVVAGVLVFGALTFPF